MKTTNTATAALQLPQFRSGQLRVTARGLVVQRPCGVLLPAWSLFISEEKAKFDHKLDTYGNLRGYMAMLADKMTFGYVSISTN